MPKIVLPFVFVCFLCLLFIISSFLLLELSRQNFMAKLIPLLPYKPDLFSNPLDSVVFKRYFYTLDILQIK